LSKTAKVLRFKTAKTGYPTNDFGSLSYIYIIYPYLIVQGE